jgi:hypothetical protein
MNEVKDLVLIDCEILRLRLKMTRHFKPRMDNTFKPMPF